jgi:hypothetical protein
LIDQLSHSFHYELEIDLLDLSINAQVSGLLDLTNQLRRVEQNLGGYATPCQTNAARLVLVDNCDTNVRILLNHGINDVHGRSRSDDNQIVFFHT